VPRLTLQAAWGWDSGGRRGQCDALANKIIEESPRRLRRAYDQFEADLAARGWAVLAYRSAPARGGAARPGTERPGKPALVWRQVGAVSRSAASGESGAGRHAVAECYASKVIRRDAGVTAAGGVGA
jgi:hypothetical protein